MNPETIKLLLLVLTRVTITQLVERGKLDQAASLTDVFAGLRAGRNIDTGLGMLAAAWEISEPALADITAARVSIQEALK